MHSNLIRQDPKAGSCETYLGGQNPVIILRDTGTSDYTCT